MCLLAHVKQEWIQTMVAWLLVSLGNCITTSECNRLDVAWMCQFSKHDQTTWQSKILISCRHWHGPSLKTWMFLLMFVQLYPKNHSKPIYSPIDKSTKWDIWNNPAPTQHLCKPHESHSQDLVDCNSFALHKSMQRQAAHHDAIADDVGFHPPQTENCGKVGDFLEQNITVALPQSKASQASDSSTQVKRKRISCYVEAQGYMHCIC